MIQNGGNVEGIAVLVVVAVAVAGEHVRGWVRSHWPDSWPWESQETPQERVRRRYVAGEIGEAEMERELDLLMDDDNERIRERLESIDGIGPLVAREVALAFDSVGHIERAERDDLLAVDDVGPERADLILSDIDQ